MWWESNEKQEKEPSQLLAGALLLLRSSSPPSSIRCGAPGCSELSSATCPSFPNAAAFLGKPPCSCQEALERWASAVAGDELGSGKSKVAVP